MRFLNVVLVCLLGVAALTTVIAGISPQAVQQSVEARMPVKAVDALQQIPAAGRMLNAYNWGSYLLWRVPDRKVFVDGRTDVFTDEILNQYVVAMSGQTGWQNVLEQWDIQILFAESSAPLVQILELKGWRVVFSDAKSIILVSPALPTPNG